MNERTRSQGQYLSRKLSEAEKPMKLRARIGSTFSGTIEDGLKKSLYEYHMKTRLGAKGIKPRPITVNF